MKHQLLGSLLFAGAAVLVAGGAAVQAQSNMSFFITSVGKGDGANLGGLAGADAHCAALAKAAGSAKTNWRAYLSTTQVQGGAGPVDARDRIGNGPWVNAKGVTIAKSVDDLHDPKNPNLTKANLLTEKGTPVNGRGDTPNTHDILTGSDLGRPLLAQYRDHRHHLRQLDQERRRLGDPGPSRSQRSQRQPQFYLLERQPWFGRAAARTRL